jgi:hypothetical protein
MRIAFTIIYNGFHHLTHNGFSDFMLANFDHWVVVEGHARAGGSTAWCKNLGMPQRSTDGTHEYLLSLSKENPKLKYFSKGTYWNSKDQQVNKAIEIVKTITGNCYLWQVDCDEQHTPCNLLKAEIALDKSGLKAGQMKFNHYLCRNDQGDQLIATGEWGSGSNIRLWKWSGEWFVTHEPPVIEGQIGVAELPVKYDHYSYYFEQDIIFKSKYYKGYDSLYLYWKRLKKFKGTFPRPITDLFGSNRHISKNSQIEIYRHEQS